MDDCYSVVVEESFVDKASIKRLSQLHVNRLKNTNHSLQKKCIQLI